MPSPSTPGDEEDARFMGKERPCACCGHPFRQTPRRRLLCARCYLSG